MRGLIVLALATVAVPVAAQDGGVWTKAGDTIAIAAAGIRVPTRAGALVLVKTDEFSHKGEGLDNYAQYESADKQVFATAYIYRPALADAALAAYATDRAVHQRFGSGVAIAEQTSVAVDGRPGSAIRTIYTGAQLEPGKPLVTAAAFATVDGWTVKLRSTGPADRRTEVIGALDALIAGLRIDKKDAIRTTRPMVFAATCPPAAGAREAKVVTATGDAAMTGMLSGAVIAAGGMSGSGAAGFPAEGTMPACVRGTIRVGQTSADLIQPAGQANPTRVLAALSDSGTVLDIGGNTDEPGYAIRLHGIGQTDIFGQLDAQPTPAQLQTWLTTPGAPALALRSRVTIAANGKPTLSLNVPGGGERPAGKK